jgi:DNA-binding transcriptional MocR family regulator
MTPLPAAPAPANATSPLTSPLYQRLASHYRQAIESGVMAPGERMPSVRRLTQLHKVSLSTAVQICHRLEDEGLLASKPRSGYFVRQPRRATLVPMREPEVDRKLDVAQFVGIHHKVSAYVAQCEQFNLKTNLAGAYAAPEAYPTEALKNAATRALRLRPTMLTAPARGQGDPALCAALARRALASGIHITPDEVLVTYGCTEALNIALRSVAQPGDTIAVESPTFYGLLQILESLGLRALEIPTSPRHGLSIEALEMALQNHPSIKAVVAIPNLHNPLGCTMSDADKQRLLALCERSGVPLIEDDTYGPLTDGDAPLRAIKSWDTTGNVIYCATLRKTLAPGMRLGWMVGGRWQARAQMIKYAQSRYNDTLSQVTVADYLNTSAYDRHMLRLRQMLKNQREQTAEAIATYFPTGTRLNLPQGSMMLWVELPDQRPVQPVFEAALKMGIRVAPGSLFSNSNRYDHFVRICCGDPYSKTLDDALRQLGALLGKA